MMPLIIRPDIESDEGLRAYVCRLATLNHSLTFFRPMLNSMSTVAASAPEIARLSGNKIEILMRHGCAVRGTRGAATGVYFGNVVLPRRLVRVKNRAVCPKCIANNGVSRCVWELHGYDVCDWHGLKLVDVCSACKQQLSWRHSSADQFACGFPLAQLDAKTGRPDRRSVCRILAASMLRTIHGDEGFAVAPPIDWVLVLCDFIAEVLIPTFCERHELSSKKRLHAIKDALTASMLEDLTYREYLLDVVFRYASSDPMTLVSTLLRGGIGKWSLSQIDSFWDHFYFHRSLWDFKHEAQYPAIGAMRRQVTRRRTAKIDVKEIRRLLDALEQPVALFSKT